MEASSREVEDILDELRDEAVGVGHLSVGQALEALGGRGFGPVLLVPALIEISPIGGIPGVPTVLAANIILFALQIAWGRDHMWLPGFVERLSVSDSRVQGAVEKLQPLARRLDRWFHGRWDGLLSAWAVRLAAACAVVLCLTVPPFELLPFASTAPMAAIALFGLAMTLRDGVLMAAGWALAAVAVLAGLLVPGGGS